MNKEKASKLKSRISRLDRELAESLNKRASLAQQLAGLESLSDVDLISRDNHDVESLLEQNEGPLPEAALRGCFRELMSGCRKLTRQTRAAFLGPRFSYSHQAAIERFGTSADLVPLGTIAGVFGEVAAGNVDYGIVPLENSTDGRISDTLTMFTRVQVRVSGEVNLRIHHNLLGKGARSKITHVLSKPQALSQCRGWLAEHLPAVELVETSSTTAAAEMAAADETKAAIASHQAGVNYGLHVLAANIEDNRDNVTRFAVLGQSSATRTGVDKTAMLLQVLHQPGALADVMMIFKRNKLNLTWIESFPLPDKNNEYFFFIEMQGHEKDLKVRKAVTALQKKTHILEVLGSYASTRTVE